MARHFGYGLVAPVVALVLTGCAALPASGPLATEIVSQESPQGVLGGYATSFPRARITMLILVVVIPLFFRVPALGYAIIWFILQFMQGFVDLVSPSMGAGIAWWAHIGGFVGGVILIPIFRPAFDPTYDEGAGRVLNIPGWTGSASKEKSASDNPSGWTRGPWG